MTEHQPIRVLQFGTGVLLRGLCCEIIDRALLDPTNPWDGRIMAVQSTGAGRADALEAAACRYGVMVRGLANGEPVRDQRTVGSIARAVAADRDWSDVLDVARSEDLRVIISNTTEAGLRPSDDDAPDDVVPRSYPAKLLRVLTTRFETRPGAAAPVVIPCELIEDNGPVLRRAVLAVADRFGVSADLRRWVANDVIFASTLVDRICTRPEEGAELDVVVEPFAQWAIQAPSRASESLAFARGVKGVSLVDDVRPYFRRKVMVLNGAHTAIVHLGLLAGHQTMRELCEDELFKRFLRVMLDREILPPLRTDGVPGVEQFASDVLERFANPFAAHKLSDIAAGTEAKIQIRLVPTVTAMGAAAACISLGVAAWLERTTRQPSAAWPESMQRSVLQQADLLRDVGVREAMERMMAAG